MTDCVKPVAVPKIVLTHNTAIEVIDKPGCSSGPSSAYTLAPDLRWMMIVGTNLLLPLTTIS
jgi:hypothetical protein